LHEALVIQRDAEGAHEIGLPLRRMRKEHLARHADAVRELHGFESVLARNETRHRGRLQSHPSSLQLEARLFRDLESAVREDDDVARPPPKLDGERQDVRGVLWAREVAPSAVLHLPSMAVGALKDRMAPRSEERRVGKEWRSGWPTTQ